MKTANLLRHENIIAHPVLKWAGGKGQLLQEINARLPNMQNIKRYVEPFIGGGAVFFDLQSRYQFDEAFLFDINPELVILYNVIKNNVDDLIIELRKIQVEYFDCCDQAEYYYARREEYNNYPKQINTNLFLHDFVRRSALTIFLNRTCFNGLFRVNSSGKFNVPIGRYANPKILDEKNLRAVSIALQNATIIQCDFGQALKYADGETFIYYDPPYRPIRNTSNFNSYAMDDFGDSEQIRLRDMFVNAHKKNALQMLSNSDPMNYIEDRFFDDLYADFNIKRVNATRRINSKSDGRSEITELLITNYD